MKDNKVAIQKQPVSKPTITRTYNEVVEYLDAHWKTNKADTKLSCVRQLDQALGNLTQSIDTIVITGTNGKSLTAHFTAKLLAHEGVNAGILYAPHMLTYNERFVVGGETISNKQFTDIGNEVINTAEMLGLKPNSAEVLLMMGLQFFKSMNTAVAIVEADQLGFLDPAVICHPKITGITRIIDQSQPLNAHVTSEPLLLDVLATVKPGTYVASADQSKQSLQLLQKLTKDRGGEWKMPVRKVAPLAYPFEQLHGRCAALAERIASIYMNQVSPKADEDAKDSLLMKIKGQRGRPTLEAKRRNELSPQKTVEQFWAETMNSLPARFQLLDKEKPSILLDSASNIDALDNLLLGVRLLHYQRPLKGLTLILGCNNNKINMVELLKMLRYFFKKTSGQVILCPIAPAVGHKGDSVWNSEQIANDLKAMKVKARATSNLKEALDAAKETVDDRHGLVVITGSQSIISEYWKIKGLKKI